MDDEKIQFKNEIKKIEKRLVKKDIVLESFILSKTSYENLIKGRTEPASKDKYIDNHVLFLEDKDWPERLLSNLISKNSA